MKRLKVTVDGKVYDVTVEEVEETEENAGNSSKLFNDNQINTNEVNSEKNTSNTNDNHESGDGEPIKSPMPGTIIAVNVKSGQKVSKGEVLMILEAMKMENEISSPRDAEICAVNVKKGDSVESGFDLLFLK